MDKQQARDIIRNTFENAFDKTQFTNFVKNLLNQIVDAPFTNQGNYIPDAYKQYITTLERIGKYSEGDHKIDILVVKLKKETSIERARTMQRNFIARYLNGSRGGELKDAALVAFVSPDNEDWRFSLVKMDYHLEEGKGGKVKAKEEFTPARRWSFLVGTNENSHTAQSRLSPIIADDTRNPKLAELEEAFNIETVTKEFFTEYRNLFLRVKEALDVIVAKDATIKNNFAQNGVNAVDFAKKLLGQIVFLYFLQKKGWFGVAKDAAWGTGSKQFLRELFEKKHSGYKNFFNDILEPLFYEALRLDRGHEDHYYSRFNCKIPFLNGGLFDPINGYDWVKTDILIANELFSNNSKTNKGDTGDGILDVFDRYNFTVKEDEPLEKEVAIDPELLGKAYEKFNAIRPDNFDEFQKALKSGKKGEESKFNKQFGVYYTPREIVHYMCQQSLINYLFSQFNNGTVTYEKPGVRQTDMLGNTGKKGQLDIVVEHKERPAIPKEDIETLIHYGERLSDNEEMALIKQQKINDGQQKTSDYKLQLPDSIRKNAIEIDSKLLGIKVCDPAIGSGAFPVGMMSEIVRARNTLSTFIKNANRSIYHFKRDCIENSLYGVDIDSGAVEIAKLRLWLSLVVDEDDIRQIKPLPNLDYKIVCGNSLLGLPADFLPDAAVSKEIEEKKKQYFSTTSPSEKNKIRASINDLFSQLMENIKKYFPSVADISFDFHTHFSEVFHEKGGFDVVIGNPPYVQLQTGKGKLANLYKNSDYETFASTGDIYCLFYEKANQLLKPKGTTCYITSNKWMRASYGEKLRKYFTMQTQPLALIDVGPGAFETATVDTNILLFTNGQAGNSFHGCLLDIKTKLSLHEYVKQNYIEITVPKSGAIWEINSPLQQVLTKKIESKGIPLKDWDLQIYRGILTGFNEAFIIDGAKRNELIAADPKCVSIIKPLLRGRDTQKYHADYSDLWLIATFPVLNLNINDYPSIRDYLKTFGKKLEQTGKKGCRKKTNHKWFETQDNIAFFDEFKKEKIVWKRIGSIMRFCYDKTGVYCLDSTCIATGDKIKFLVGVLNSSVCIYELFRTSPKTGTGDQIISVQALEPLRIPKPSKNQETDITNIVDKILTLTQSNDYIQNPAKQAKVKEYEKEIDQMVYTLYGLTPDEIAIVEGRGTQGNL